jgi:hypothetical protein
MFRRLRGALIILRVLLPFLLVIGLALATWAMARHVVAATQDYGERLSSQLDEIKAAVDEANEGLQAIGGFVVATAGAAETLAGRVADLSDSVTIPLPDVAVPEFTIPVINRDIDLPDFRLGDGDLSIPIPGVAPLKSLAGELVEAGQQLTDPMVKMAALADVPPNLEEAATDTVEYAGEIRTTMTTWLGIVLILLVVAALVWLFAALRPTLEELHRGWSLLMGRTPPEASVRDLERELASLRRRVAALG